MLLKNDSGEEIPACSIVVKSGIERLANNRIAVKVKKIAIPPTVAGRQQIIVVGQKKLGVSGASQYGSGWYALTREQWVAFDDADGTPAFGEMWGVADGQNKLKKDNPGFEISGAVDDTLRRVQAVFIESPRYYFKLTNNLSAPTNMEGTPETATADLYKSSLTSQAILVGQNVTLQNRWEDLELDLDKRGRVEWDWQLMEWVIYATECP